MTLASVNSLSSEQLEQYDNEGYIILKNFWPEEILKIWEETIISFYYMQAKKLPKIRESVNNTRTVDGLDTVLLLYEKYHKQSGFHAGQLVRSSMMRNFVFTQDFFVSTCSQLLRCSKELLNIDEGVVFPSIPSSKRLLYQWHSEASYYPKRNHFLNGWFPVFRNKTKQNGTMIVMPKSHKKEYWDFMEHFGYDDTSPKTQTREQFEVPASSLSEYETVPIDIERGDMCFFDRNLLHASTINESDKFSYASVVRIFDVKDDLTLSSTLDIRPFTEENHI